MLSCHWIDTVRVMWFRKTISSESSKVIFILCLKKHILNTTYFIKKQNPRVIKEYWDYQYDSAVLFTVRFQRNLNLDVERCCLLQHCLVLSLDSWLLKFAQLRKHLCYIFRLKNVGSLVCLTPLAKARWGFPINKCTGNIYTVCGTWRHNTHDILFSSQCCHKSLWRIK